MLHEALEHSLQLILFRGVTSTSDVHPRDLLGLADQAMNFFWCLAGLVAGIVFLANPPRVQLCGGDLQGKVSSDQPIPFIAHQVGQVPARRAEGWEPNIVRSDPGVVRDITLAREPA